VIRSKEQFQIRASGDLDHPFFFLPSPFSSSIFFLASDSEEETRWKDFARFFPFLYCRVILGYQFPPREGGTGFLLFFSFFSSFSVVSSSLLAWSPKRLLLTKEKRKPRSAGRLRCGQPSLSLFSLVTFVLLQQARALLGKDASCRVLNPDRPLHLPPPPFLFFLSAVCAQWKCRD